MVSPLLSVCLSTRPASKRPQARNRCLKETRATGFDRQILTSPREREDAFRVGAPRQPYVSLLFRHLFLVLFPSPARTLRALRGMHVSKEHENEKENERDTVWKLLRRILRTSRSQMATGQIYSLAPRDDFLRDCFRVRSRNNHEMERILFISETFEVSVNLGLSNWPEISLNSSRRGEISKIRRRGGIEEDPPSQIGGVKISNCLDRESLQSVNIARCSPSLLSPRDFAREKTFLSRGEGLKIHTEFSREFSKAEERGDRRLKGPRDFSIDTEPRTRYYYYYYYYYTSVREIRKIAGGKIRPPDERIGELAQPPPLAEEGGKVSRLINFRQGPSTAQAIHPWQAGFRRCSERRYENFNSNPPGKVLVPRHT